MKVAYWKDEIGSTEKVVMWALKVMSSAVNTGLYKPTFQVHHFGQVRAELTEVGQVRANSQIKTENRIYRAGTVSTQS